MTGPHPIDLVRDLRGALGLFDGAMPITPQAAWEEALAEVERLRDDNQAWAVRWQEQYDRAERLAHPAGDRP